jgi:hypothetical protein
LFLSGSGDELIEFVQYFGFQFSGGAEEAGYGFAGGIVEEGLEEMFHRIAAGFGAGDAGGEDVAGAVLLMLDVAFVLEDFDQGTDGGVAGRVREGGQDFGGGGAATLVKDVHDLALAAAEFFHLLNF